MIENPDGQPALSDTGESLTDPGYAITPPKLGERFERDWRAKGVDFEYVCEALGGSCNQFTMYLD